MCLSWSAPASCAGPLLRARGRNRNRRACPGQFSTRNGGELRASSHGELSAARRMVCQAPSALARPVRLRRSHGDVSGIRIVSRETTSRLPSLPWLQGAESRPNPLEHPRGRAGCGLPPPAARPPRKPAAKAPRNPDISLLQKSLDTPPRNPAAEASREPRHASPTQPRHETPPRKPRESPRPTPRATRHPRLTQTRHESPPRKPATHASGNPAIHALRNSWQKPTAEATHPALVPRSGAESGTKLATERASTRGRHCRPVNSWRESRIRSLPAITAGCFT